uniref:Uncharacterized protein n=1 Tax=Arion vulgaris TaxID=1028688 RepID=A0A0B6ZH63_9EUPU
MLCTVAHTTNDQRITKYTLKWEEQSSRQKEISQGNPEKNLTDKGERYQIPFHNGN